MKLNNNWKDKTLENLENDYWDDPGNITSLVATCHNLRKKTLRDFNTEDLRIMIGQNIGLYYLIPMAIDLLKTNILVSGDFYEGDLLTNVLNSDKVYWENEKDNWKIVCSLFQENINLLEQYDTTEEIKDEWFKLFSDFKKVN